MQYRPTLSGLVACLLTCASSIPILAQPTAFTYQGRLTDGTNAANGSYDLIFALFDSSKFGDQVGDRLTNAAIAVDRGQFAVTLDFGAEVFTGANRWLEIGVRSNGVAAFTTLVPRQPLTAAPYAIFAGGVTAGGISGSIPAGNIAGGTITSAMLEEGAAAENLGAGVPEGAMARTNGQGYGATSLEQLETRYVTIGLTNPPWFSFGSGGPEGSGISFIRPNGESWSALSWYRTDEEYTNFVSIGADVAYNGAFFAMLYDNTISSDTLRYGLHGGQAGKWAFGNDGINTNAYLSIHDPLDWHTAAYPNRNVMEVLSVANGIALNSRSNRADLLQLQRDGVFQEHWLAFEQGAFRWRLGIPTNTVDIYNWQINLSDDRDHFPGSQNTGGRRKIMELEQFTGNMNLWGGLRVGSNYNNTPATITLNGTVTISSGRGSPQGAVIANVGSLYLRTDGGSSTTLYIKTSGSNNNTGWTAK